MRRQTSLRSFLAWSAWAWVMAPAALALAGDAGNEAVAKGSPDNAGPLPTIADFDESFEEGLVDHAWAEGLRIDIGLRSVAFLATDCCRLRGFGGATSLRLSTWLSPRLRWVLRFDGAGIPARQRGAPVDGERSGDEVTLNQQNALTVGVQAVRLGPVWLETGLGVANYSLRSADESIPDGNRDGGGIAVVSAVGTNIIKGRRWRLALEVTFLGSLYTRIDGRRDQGFIGQFGFGLSTGFQ